VHDSVDAGCCEIGIPAPTLLGALAASMSGRSRVEIIDKQVLFLSVMARLLSACGAAPRSISPAAITLGTPLVIGRGKM
jgi:hypothetical protein